MYIVRVSLLWLSLGYFSSYSPAEYRCTRFFNLFWFWFEWEAHAIGCVVVIKSFWNNLLDNIWMWMSKARTFEAEFHFFPIFLRKKNLLSDPSNTNALYYRHLFHSFNLKSISLFPCHWISVNNWLQLTHSHKNGVFWHTHKHPSKSYSAANSSFLPLFPILRTPNCKPKRSRMVPGSLECVCVRPLGRKKCVCLIFTDLRNVLWSFLMLCNRMVV